MSSVHCVVVWEWQHDGEWLPHTPGVTRILERSHAKKLTRVVLADADPELKGHYVNLRTLTQCLDTSEGVSEECLVRRACYSVSSVAGRGVRWEWARLQAGRGAAELQYAALPVQVQCALEQGLQAGARVSWRGWAGWPARGSARSHAGQLALLRRATSPPYPLTRNTLATQNTLATHNTHHSHNPHSAPTPPPLPDISCNTEGRRPRIPQQHTGSSVHSVHSVQSAHSIHSTHSAPATHTPPAPRAGARSASPRDRKPGLARQILHNLNIFSHHNKQGVQAECHSKEELSERHTDTECSSTRSTRRHSVDTVSTYLSHESKESLQQASVGELLNCSAGSDDVFETPSTAHDIDTSMKHLNIADGGSLGGGEGVWGVVVSEACPQWGALCPACLAPLARARAVVLAPCRHALHLHCLQRHLLLLQARGEALYIECLVCGRVYDEEGGSESPALPPAPPPAPAAPPAPSPRPPRAPQPPGSMAWSVQPTALPQHPHCTAAILVTYNFQSGRQGAAHPSPGARYYAVGFPRHSLLPDTPLGREVLSVLRVVWERGCLFTVSASQTTGREHVVCWSVPPPPAAPHHYAPPARPDALLHAALHRLTQLL